jgi:hypothetical protein
MPCAGLHSGWKINIPIGKQEEFLKQGRSSGTGIQFYGKNNSFASILRAGLIIRTGIIGRGSWTGGNSMSCLIITMFI